MVPWLLVWLLRVESIVRSYGRVEARRYMLGYIYLDLVFEGTEVYLVRTLPFVDQQYAGAMCYDVVVFLDLGVRGTGAIWNCIYLTYEHEWSRQTFGFLLDDKNDGWAD